MAGAREVLFRIFYSTSFTIVFLILVSFVAVSPADKIYQSYRRNRIVDIFIEAGAYILTALIAVFLYASRLYTNRSVLREIPKTYLPIEKEDLPAKRVHRLIEECLARSAVVAYYAKPRARRIEVEVPNAGQRMLAITRQTKTHHHEHHLTEYEQGLLEPTWGTINHPGWQSPAAEEMPGLEFASVVDELIDLVEAKAVSLAPPDPLATPNEDGTTPPDPRVVDQLARPDNAGMRQYLSILTDIGVVPETELSEEFTLRYEKARFSATPTTDRDFKVLMRMFAELLRSMQPVDIDMLNLTHDDDDDDDDPNDDLEPHNKRPSRARPPSSAGASTFSASSVRHLPTSGSTSHLPRRMSSDSAPSMSEDDLTPSLHTALSLTTTHSHSQSRQPPPHPQYQHQEQQQDAVRPLSRPRPPDRSSTRFFSAQSISRPTLRREHSDLSVASRRSGRSARSRISDMSRRSGRSNRSNRSDRSTGTGRSNASNRSNRSNRGNRSGSSVIRLTEMTNNDIGAPYVIQVPSRR
jgi:hypothetical protein